MKKKVKVVMLPTQKASTPSIGLLLCVKSYVSHEGIYAEDRAEEGDLRAGVTSYCDEEFWKPHHLYLLSDEKIKEGNNVYCSKPHNSGGKNLILNVNKSQSETFNIHDYYYKIIATTDGSLQVNLSEEQKENLRFASIGAYKSPQIPDSFIKAYAESGGNIDEVMVEVEHNKRAKASEPQHVLKKRGDNTVIIHKADSDVLNRFYNFVLNEYSQNNEIKNILKEAMDKFENK